MDFDDGFRIGLPFFLPIDPSFDTRLQVVDNVSYAVGNHLIKTGLEYNRTRAEQQFVGLANSRYIFDSVDGFIGFVTHGNRYVTCSDGSANALGICPPGTQVSGPVLLYLQSATVPGVPADQLGRQQFETHELGLFVQDTWHPHERVTLDLGLRWDGAWHPAVFVDPADTFFAPYLDDPRFPSDGRIPNDLDNLQPRTGLAWDLAGDGRTVLRANAGSYVARIPMLVFAQHRSTNGAFQQTLFRSSPDAALGPVPAVDQQIDGSSSPPFLPDIQVADRDLQLPRTWSLGAGLERDLGRGLAASIGYIHARTDNLFRFVNRNDAALGAPFGIGTHPFGGGINTLTVAESSARSRYHSVTAGLRGRGSAAGRPLTFEAHYTLAFDRSDDDNERDPFTLRYAHAGNLAPEYGWSDRDRRHQDQRLPAARPAGGPRSEQRRALPVGVARLRAVRQPRGARRPAVGPRLRGRIDPSAQHAAAAERVLHLGPAGVTALHARRRNDARADPGGVQRDERRQLRRPRRRLPAVQLRRLAAQRPR